MTTYATLERKLPARMSHQEAALVLRKYNEYRMGDHEPCDPPYSGKVIGEAIDVAIAALEPSIVPTLENIIKAVSKETGVTEEEMTSRKRFREYAEARYICFWIAYNYTSSTMTCLARRLNACNHSIVYYGIKKGDEWMQHPSHNPEWVKRAKRIINSFLITDDNDKRENT